MGRSRKLTSRDLQREKSRATIVSEAKKLFAEFGYHGTGMEAIGAAANIKRGGLYYHIGSKQKLLYDILYEATQWPLDRSKVIIQSDQSPPEKLRALCRMHMLSVGENLDEYKILMRDFEYLEADNRERISVLRDKYEKGWLSVLQDGIDKNVFRKVDPITIKGVLGQLNFAFMWWQPNGRLSPDAAADVFYDVLLNGIAIK